MTKDGEPYVGRREVYKKGEANILFVLGELKKRQPNADYDHLTMVGHSNGGDTSMYFAKHHPDIVSKVVTLDNLRVPFVTSDKMKILSFRSDDPNFKTDPGVLPNAEQAVKNGIDIIKTPFQHTQMSDRGPEFRKGENPGSARSIPGRQLDQRIVAEQHRQSADRQAAGAHGDARGGSTGGSLAKSVRIQRTSARGACRSEADRLQSPDARSRCDKIRFVRTGS